MSESTKIPETPEREQRKSESSDTEHDPQFSPIISLPEVQLSTNEEEEDEILKLRAKLYRFDNKCDPPEWKERGTGELKILEHKEKILFRIVMRRDKTLKICANHYIMPWMELKPSQTNEKAFIYTVMADFADEETKSECLAVKFANVDNANLFKDTFEGARNELIGLKVEENTTNGDASKIIGEQTETNDVTEKLSKLDVKEEAPSNEQENEKSE